METPPPAPPEKLPTVEQQWVLVAVIALIVSGCLTADYVTFPKETRQGQRTPLSVVAGIVAALGHAMWISMDRKRRGLEVGKWRFGAIFLGPFVIALYLAWEYKLRALYLIPVLVLVYVAVGIVPVVVMAVRGLAP